MAANEEQIRSMLVKLQPEVYGGLVHDDDLESIELAADILREIAHKSPEMILDVLLDDVARGIFAEKLIDDVETPSLDQITTLARRGDYVLAQERSQLAFNLRPDQKSLVNRLLENASNFLKS